MWFAVIGMIVLLGGLYVAGHYLIGNRLPTGARIGGVGVGGLTPAQAEERLEKDLAPNTKKKLTFYHEQREFEIDPDDIGLQLHIEESVEEAGGGRTWNPVGMVERLVGAERNEPVVSVNEPKLDKRIKAIASKIDEPSVEPRVAFRNGKRVVRKPEVGREVHRSEFADVVEQQFTEDEEQAPVPVGADKPDVSNDKLQQALTSKIDRAVGSPVRLRVGKQRYTLSSADIKSVLTYVSRDGQLRPQIARKGFTRLLADKTAKLRRPPKPATVVLRNGSPKVVAHKAGRGIKTAGVRDAFTKAIQEKKAGKRVVKIEVTKRKAKFTKADAKKLKIKERVSSFVTRYPRAKYRDVNQGRAAELIDGTVLRPGDTFSFNDVVGERTRANGFTSGTIIQNGVFTDALGGGVSQVVTTLFNAAFFAGMKDVEHHPHSFYIDRYPIGREATVAYPSLDLKFKNTTDYGVLINAWIVPSSRNGTGEMHVELWSTKTWNIKSGKGKPHNFKKPGVQFDKSNKCIEQSGVRGFDIDVYRKFIRGGDVVRRETMSTTYEPADRVVCRKKRGR